MSQFLASKQIENQPYYHGFRSLEDVKNELKNPGDFLVRTDQSSKASYVIIDVRTKQDILSLVVSDSNESSGKFFVPNQQTASGRSEFNFVVDLVDSFRITPLPDPIGITLKNGIPRPKWLLKHSSVLYLPKDKLGSGNFCDVFKGSFVDSNKQATTVAIKVCHQSVAMTSSEEAAEVIETRRSMLREAKLMSRHSHPNVIEFNGIACDHLPLMIVLEFCPGGSLEDVLVKNHDISTEERILYCFDIARGMRYLHHHRCIHRDLATRNVLIGSKGYVKIADFGLSKTLSLSKTKRKEKQIKHVPIRWMAPETLSKTPVYSMASDVWSYGILIYEVYNKGSPPWANNYDFKAIGKNIRNFEMPKLPANTPPIMTKLIEDKIWIEASHRASFKDIFVILVNYVTDNIKMFPPVKDLYLNKISGVHREQILSESKKTLLEDEKELKRKSALSKKKTSTKRGSRVKSRQKSTMKKNEKISTDSSDAGRSKSIQNSNTRGSLSQDSSE